MGGRWLVSQSDYFLDWFDTLSGRESADQSLAKYLTNEFNARESEYITSYISDPSTLAGPTNVPFRAWLTEGAEDSIGKLGEIEYELLCADCDDGESGISYCVGSWGETDYSLCKSEKNELHGDVNRCSCLPGFDGPLCHVRPVEGTSSLHLDHRTGVCSTCGEENPWSVWTLDGNSVTCVSMGTLLFNDGNETFTRQLGIHLNMTHFSVFVSRNEETIDTLCEAKEGTDEIHSISRDVSDEWIYVNYAIHLDNTKDSLGEAVDPEEVECLATTELDHDVCSSNLALAQVYNNDLEHAWLLLDLTVTPISRATVELLPEISMEGESFSVSPTALSKGEEEASTDNTIIATSQNDTSLAVPVTPLEQDITSPSVSSTPLLEAASNAATAQKYKFAVIPKSTTNAFFAPVKLGCEERAATLSRQSVRGGVIVECLFTGPDEIERKPKQKLFKI